MIVNCWFLHMDVSSTIIKEKSFGPLCGGRGGPTGRSIRDAVDGRCRAEYGCVGADAADGRGRPIGRFRGPPSDRGKAVHLTSSFPLTLAGEVRSSIWLVLKTIHWLLTLGKGEVHFSGRGELFAFCRCFFQVAHDAEDQEEGQNEDESGGIR
jgi:hypothetical protein